MSEDKDAREQVAEEPPEDLELKDEDAEKVGGQGDISITKKTDGSSPKLF
jgi:hypothetical protein